jgi:mannose-6-phosphate isomerase-like protein (cupin superfamily)
MTDNPVTKGKFSAPVNHDVVASDWNERGYGCHLFVDPSGQQWLGFVHPTNELVTVTEGLLEVSCNGQTAILQPGDEIFIPKNGVHDVINRSDGVTRWLYGYD